MSHDDLDERYPDLLQSDQDARLRRLISDLDATAHHGRPPQSLRLALTEAFSERHETSTPRGRRWPWTDGKQRWARRFVPVCSAVGIVILTVGGVFAAKNFVDRSDSALSYTPSGQQLVLKHLGTPINRSVTACGFTLTLNQVYIDKLRAEVAYTITAPATRDWSWGQDLSGPMSVTLTTPGGASLPYMEMNHGFGEAASSGVSVFSSFGVITREQSASLRVQFSAISMIEQMGSGVPANVPCERYSPVTSMPQSNVRDVSIPGPFSFNVRVPVLQQMHTVALHQVVKLNGANVTLEGIQVSPIDTRVLLTSSGPLATDNLYAFIVLPGGKAPLGEAGSMSTSYHGNVYYSGIDMGTLLQGEPTYRFNVPVFDYHAGWTIEVSGDQRAFMDGAPKADFHVRTP